MSADDHSHAMKRLFSAYNDDDELDESRHQEVDQHRHNHNDSDENMSDMEGTVNDINTRHFSASRSLTWVDQDKSKTEDKFNEQWINEKEEDSSEKRMTFISGNIDTTAPALKKSATRLVSYGPDDVDDEDDEYEKTEANASDDEILFKSLVPSYSELTDNTTSMTKAELNNSLASLRHSLSEDEVQLPAEPTGKCSMKLQDKVSKLYAKAQRSGFDMNASIQKKKGFRNPSIYEKLIEFCGIDEKGTNYPPELYNPTIWGPESNYEYLAKQQKADLDRRERERKEKLQKEKGINVERLVGTKKVAYQMSGGGGGSSPEQKRRTKWDSHTAGGASGAAMQIPAIGPISKPKPNV